jgi:calcineurin-like phosphoesterase family protein
MNNKISKTYLISDSHWGHKHVAEYCNRPDNFEQKIKNNWKHLVQPHDIIIHLGDVIFGNRQQLTDILKDLPGTKILVRGNHDKGHSDNFYLVAGFSLVCEKIMIKNYLLSHRPTLLLNNDTINIHGHFHNVPMRQWEKDLHERLTENHYLLALEFVDYKPIPLLDAIKKQLVVKTKEVSW